MRAMRCRRRVLAAVAAVGAFGTSAWSFAAQPEAGVLDDKAAALERAI